MMYSMQNIKRNRGKFAKGHIGYNTLKTHCPNGHKYNLENTYVWGNGYRRCRPCNNRLSSKLKRAYRLAHPKVRAPLELNANCYICNSSFHAKPSVLQQGKQKYCSKRCRTVGKRRNMLGKNTGERPYFKGNGNPNWRGGITPQNRLGRSGAQYREWRKAVFERDNYTCKNCGKRGGNLEADHIKQFAFYPELRFNKDNGRTLCQKCHRQIPVIYKLVSA